MIFGHTSSIAILMQLIGNLNTVITTSTTTLYTAATSTSIAPAPIITEPFTTTLTSTSVIPAADMDTTSTSTETFWFTTTQTDVTTSTTTTSTTVSLFPTQTAFSVCDNPRNYIGPSYGDPALGYTIVGVYPHDGTTYYGPYLGGIFSAHDCCELCARTDNCASSYWMTEDSMAPNSCALMISASNTCTNQGSSIVEGQYGLHPAQKWIVSNGQCGWSTGVYIVH